MDAPIALPESARETTRGYEWTRATDGESSGTVFRLTASGCPTLNLKTETGQVGGARPRHLVELFEKLALASRVSHFFSLGTRGYSESSGLNRAAVLSGDGLRRRDVRS